MSIHNDRVLRDVSCQHESLSEGFDMFVSLLEERFERFSGSYPDSKEKIKNLVYRCTENYEYGSGVLNLEKLELSDGFLEKFFSASVLFWRFLPSAVIHCDTKDLEARIEAKRRAVLPARLREL